MRPTTNAPPGSVVLVDGSEKVSVSLKDGVMPEPSRAAFNVIYSVHHPSDVTDDDIFGTKTPKAVGDSWPMNSALASEDLKGTGLSIAADKLHGKVTLKSIDTVGSAACLDLVGDMQADTFAPGDAPPGTTFDQTSITAVFRGCFPVNPAVPSHREGGDVSFQMRVHQKDGPAVDVSFSQKSDSTWIGSSE